MLQGPLLSWWLVGAAILILGWPVLIGGHLLMLIRDHQRQRNWRTTGLAIAWPIPSVALIGILQGNLSPPLFGVPIAVLFTMAWWNDERWFKIGLVLFYSLAAAVVVVFGLMGDADIHWWFLALWPTSLILLLLWRRSRWGSAIAPSTS